MPSKKCSRCGLYNPAPALRCDCGYDFQSGQIKESYLSCGAPTKRTRNSWWIVVRVTAALMFLFFGLTFSALYNGQTYTNCLSGIAWASVAIALTLAPAWHSSITSAKGWTCKIVVAFGVWFVTSLILELPSAYEYQVWFNFTKAGAAIRLALAEYTEKSANHVVPPAESIRAYTALRALVNQYGGMLSKTEERMDIRFESYETQDTDHEGFPDDYILLLSVPGVPGKYAEKRLRVTRDGIERLDEPAHTR